MDVCATHGWSICTPTALYRSVCTVTLSYVMLSYLRVICEGCSSSDFCVSVLPVCLCLCLCLCVCVCLCLCLCVCLCFAIAMSACACVRWAACSGSRGPPHRRAAASRVLRGVRPLRPPALSFAPPPLSSPRLTDRAPVRHASGCIHACMSPCTRVSCQWLHTCMLVTSSDLFD